MKFIYTIFLLLITAVYILPVKDIIKESPGISITDVAEEKEEIKDKEKIKEFISFSPVAVIIPVNSFSKYRNNTLNLPAFFHTIETPPPDSCT
jgi:hypothetical protein